MIELIFTLVFLCTIGAPIIIAIILAITISKNNNKYTNSQYINNKTQHGNQTEYATNPDYRDKYQSKNLLTRNEWHEYKKLKIIAEQKNLIICPKVRLLDIIEPRNNVKNYMTLLAKVQSKHIDFVICDQNMKIIAALEIDDNSHNIVERRNRDAFVDEILNSVGYKVIRTHAITDTTLDDIETQEESLDKMLKDIAKYK